MDKEIIISDTLDAVGRMQYECYITHAYCIGGECYFTMDGRQFHFSKGDCLIVPHQKLEFTVVQQSDDFDVEVIYVRSDFIQTAMPYSNYGTRGHFALFENPVMHLTPNQQQVCTLNFDYIRCRLAVESHRFHREAMRNAVECMIIDFFDFHAELYGNVNVGEPQAQLMQQFISMLERGDYRKKREVGYYADVLCVTPKHLSEVSKRVSGQSMPVVSTSAWPLGEPNDAYAKYFTGQSYLALLDSVSGLCNVSFEPGCRNNWHVHHGAVQMLICVSGRGWYQEWGKPAVELKPGVTIAVPEGVKHWHGAAKDSWMQHLTYHANAKPGNSNEWLEPVTDEQYSTLQ